MQCSVAQCLCIKASIECHSGDHSTFSVCVFHFPIGCIAILSWTTKLFWLASFIFKFIRIETKLNNRRQPSPHARCNTSTTFFICTSTSCRFCRWRCRIIRLCLYKRVPFDVPSVLLFRLLKPLTWNVASCEKTFTIFPNRNNNNIPLRSHWRIDFGDSFRRPSGYNSRSAQPSY